MNAGTLVRATVAATLALTLSACGKGKVDECNEFIGRANLSQAVLKTINITGDAKQIEADAAKVDNEVEYVKNAAVKDEKLIKFRDDYAANLAKMASTIRALAKSQSPASMKQIHDDVDAIEKTESKLITESNAYCGGR